MGHRPQWLSLVWYVRCERCKPPEVKSSKIGIIFSFAKSDPFETFLEQHFPTSTGYIDIAWNLVAGPL